MGDIAFGMLALSSDEIVAEGVVWEGSFFLSVGPSNLSSTLFNVLIYYIIRTSIKWLILTHRPQQCVHWYCERCTLFRK